MKKFSALIFGILTGFVSLSMPAFADGQGWSNNSLTIGLTSKWNLKLTKEIRADEVTLTDPYLRNLQGGLTYKLPGNFTIAALYKRENVKKTGYNLGEDRYTIEGVWKTGLNTSWDMDLRLRAEIRHFDKGLAENHMRYRLRLRLRTNLMIGGLEIRPFIASEPFADSLQGRIFRHRLYLGSTVPLNKNAEIVINYIRQDTRKGTTLHILNTGVDLKF